MGIGFSTWIYDFALKYEPCFVKRALTLSQSKILDAPKLKEFAEGSFKFDENGRKFSKWIENTAMSNFSFSHSVFKRLLLQTR